MGQVAYLWLGERSQASDHAVDWFSAVSRFMPSHPEMPWLDEDTRCTLFAGEGYNSIPLDALSGYDAVWAEDEGDAFNQWYRIIVSTLIADDAQSVSPDAQAQRLVENLGRTPKALGFAIRRVNRLAGQRGVFFSQDGVNTSISIRNPPSRPWINQADYQLEPRGSNSGVAQVASLDRSCQYVIPVAVQLATGKPHGIHDKHPFSSSVDFKLPKPMDQATAV